MEEENKPETLLFLDRLLFWGLIAFVPFISLAISPWQFDAVDLTKFTILLVWVFLLFAIWSVRVMLSKKVVVRRTKLDFILLAFLGIFALATVFSIHYPTSLYGRYGRYEGFITYLAYASVFFFSSQSFINYERMKILAISIISSAVVVSCYGLAQHLGYDFITWAGRAFEAQRSFSTLGNPLILAGFLVTVAPIAAAFSLLFLTGKSIQKWVWLGAVLLILISIWVTFSRGAWLALMIGLLFLFLILRKTVSSSRWITYIGVLFLVSVLVVGLLTARSAATTNLLARAYSSIDPSKGSFATRLEIWKSALRIVRHQSLLGTGPDTFIFKFFKFQTLRYIRLQERIVIADNAHSYPLQLASSIGIPGMAIFVALFLLLFFSSLRQIQKSKDLQVKILLSGFLAGALAYLIHLMFALSAVGSTTFFWIITGALMAQVDSTKVQCVKWKLKNFMWRLVTVFLVAGLCLALVSLAIRPYLADVRFSKAIVLADIGSWQEAANEFELAIMLNPRNDRYKGELGLMHFTWSQVQSNNIILLKRAVFHLNEAKRSSPLMVDNYYILALIYRYMGEQVDPEYYGKAADELKIGLSLEPNSPKLLSTLGSIYLEQGKMEKALKELREAQNIKPDYPPIYLILGDLYKRKREWDRARYAYEKAINIDPSYEKARRALRELVDEKKDIEGAMDR